MTALHYACQEGHLSVVDKLLAAGCNKEARNDVSVFACDIICVFYFVNCKAGIIVTWSIS